MAEPPTRPTSAPRPAGPGFFAAPPFLLLALAAVPITATSQSVQGTVIGADYERPLDGAEVTLMTTASATVDMAATDSAGRFLLHAPSPGTFIVHVAPPGYLSSSTAVELSAHDTADVTIRMPVVSEAAARVMGDVIDREAAFQLPWAELCGEPVRPWETGVLVGVSRRRSDLEPVPRAVVRIERLDDDRSSDPGVDPAPGDTAGAGTWSRIRVATETGAFWFCNVPPGRVRVTARAEGFAQDRWEATIRIGTISWYDALLRARR
ncbi:MAG: carboxypeptidase-like regulatory domain-containing protein [Longimicrobiales bacterium]